MVKTGSERERRGSLQLAILVVRDTAVGAGAYAGFLIAVSWLFSLAIDTTWIYPVNTAIAAFMGPTIFGFWFFKSGAWMVWPVVAGLALFRHFLPSRMSSDSLRIGRKVFIGIAIFGGLGYLGMQLVSDLSSQVDDQYLLLRIDISALLVLFGAVWFDARARRRATEHAIN